MDKSELTNQDGAVANQTPASIVIQTCCKKCDRDMETKNQYIAMTCTFCDKWECKKCANLSPTQIQLFDRGNLYYACETCQDFVNKFAIEMRSNHGSPANPETKHSAATNTAVTAGMDQQLVVLKSEIEQRFCDLENLIKQTKGDITSSMSTSVETAVNNNVSKAMDNAIHSVSDKVEKSVETSWARCVGDNKNAVITNSPEETQKFITFHSKRCRQRNKEGGDPIRI